MVVRDRLKEMQEASRHCKDGEQVELKPLKGAEAGRDFSSFLEVAEQINAGIDEVKRNIEEMRLMQKKILGEPIKSEREKYQAKHSDLVEENKVKGRRLQGLIKAEQENLKKLEESKKKTSQDHNELRLKKTQIQTASNRFLEIWTEYNTLQVQHREKFKKELAKTIKITNATMTQEEIEEKVDKGDFSVFASMQETAAAREQLVQIENRHKDFERLEKGIREIHEMFTDISIMVAEQGEMVDRIDVHVLSAEADIEKGREQLGKAENLQKSARKKKIILGGILAAVILIILLVILSEFGAFSGGDGGGTTTIIKNNYIYVMPDGERVESEVERPELRVFQHQAADPVEEPPAPLEEEEGSGLAVDYEDSSKAP